MIKENIKIEKDWSWIFAAILLSVVCIFSQLNPIFDIFITIVFLIVAFLFIKSDEFVLIYAVLAVFAPRLYLFRGGVSLVNVFILIYLLYIIVFKEKKQLGIAANLAIILLILYGIFVVFPINYKVVPIVNYTASILLLLSLLKKLQSTILLKKFLITISISSVAACIYGVFNINSKSFSDNVSTIELIQNRFKGVSSDPNYMAITLLFGLLGVLLISNQYKIIKIGLVTILSYFLFTTQSTTSIISLLLITAIYLIMKKKQVKLIGLYFTFIVFLIVIILFWNELYLYIISNESASLFAKRITLQINDVLIGNSKDIGSGRLVIAEGYLNYFIKQNPLNIIFGGNLCGVFGIGDFVFQIFPGRYATHNTQIDLLFSIGLLGWSIFSFIFIKSLINSWTMYFKTNEIVYKIIFILKSVILVYTFSLSFFPSWMILLFYLLDFNISTIGGNKRNENLDYSR